MKIRTLLSQTVDVRRFDIRVPMAAQIPPPPIISKYKNYVGTLRRLSNSQTKQSSKIVVGQLDGANSLGNECKH